MICVQESIDGPPNLLPIEQRMKNGASQLHLTHAINTGLATLRFTPPLHGANVLISVPNEWLCNVVPTCSDARTRLAWVRGTLYDPSDEISVGESSREGNQQ